ncbi:MAG: tRNA uridine-5-carboxymethylaminomethyl(34) synthesis enzyme MnmG [Candidatus Schekmanbacteria bacterium RIFCSPHIGHO2_02_FULL_38_11]|nr:MAG: tRNA uridine-5-carboxymethylaminomethyl(34) synthesis enzyme MnmG [Candidatus Schekmanbacteria bacterium RIFCSPHIGHO2_02_FULL_38_11]
MNHEPFDVIVVGAGHAGCEAALAAARMGCKTIVFTINLNHIALMSCNPAVGGLAKGHIVKEIDALGGEMGKNIDKTGIQFRMLNTKKGPAVWGPRAQADKIAYKNSIREVLERCKNLTLREAEISEIITFKGKVYGAKTINGEFFEGKTVVLTTGTFLRGLLHIGLEQFPAGRMEDPPAMHLSKNLEALEFKIGRLKTGTPPRLRGSSIDFSSMKIQEGDENPEPFSHLTRVKLENKASCYIGYTNNEVHEYIKSNLNKSPLYSGVIVGIGPRYCPSIEDKVVKFSEKDRHQIFFEPEGLNCDQIYPNGISTSLPQEVQINMLYKIKGLENVEIIRPGYAIEYDFVFPTQLKPSLETKLISGLLHAGQINGTSGYEEAAAQGLIAGINAALKVFKKEPFVLKRSESYIGVLIDDLVTLGTKEPYRMFTSRAEYRLFLRQDNADMRLMKYGRELGLITEEAYNYTEEKRKIINEKIFYLKNTSLNPSKETNKALEMIGEIEISIPQSLDQILKRPEISFEHIKKISDGLDKIPQDIARQIEIQVKYEGYIKRQEHMIEKFKKLENIKIPQEIKYSEIKGLSREAIEKFENIKPISLGQASRISGITPAAISALMVYIKVKYENSKLKAGQQIL